MFKPNPIQFKSNRILGRVLEICFVLTVMVAIVLGTSGFQGKGGTGGSKPPTPTGLTATAGIGTISLTWNASTGATSYRVKRSLQSGKNYVTIASPTATYHLDTNVQSGTRYYYVVTAVNSYGESAKSAQVSAVPLPTSFDPAIAFTLYNSSTWSNFLAVMNANGQSQTQLSNYYVGRPAFSPDGTRIAYAGGGPLGIGIYVMNRDGSGLFRVRAISNFDDQTSCVDWALMPDGVERIVYMDFVPGISMYHVFLTNLAGTEQRLVAAPDPLTGDCTSPTFSADGSTVYYLGYPSDLEYYGADIIGVRYSSVLGQLVEEERTSWVYDVPGSPFNDQELGWWFYSISASRVGNKLAVEAWKDFDPTTDVFVLDLDNPTAALNLTNTPTLGEWSPTWSPDDSKIAFSTRINGYRTIATVPASGGALANLSNNTSSILHMMPYWRRTP